MVKKIIIVLILLFFVEIAVSLSMLAAFQLWSFSLFTEQKPSTSYIVIQWPEKLILTHETKKWALEQNTLADWKPAKQTVAVAVPSPLANYFYEQTGISKPSTNATNSAIVKNPLVNEQGLGQYLLNLEGQINRPPQEAKLTIENERATAFAPHISGQILDLAESRKLFKEALSQGKQNLALPVITLPPKTELADLNSLGIKALLARGQTDFSGSSPSRIQNIKMGASRYRGLIIKAGEEFSFNKYLGPIDAAHGFLPELVIKPEGTVPEFGGGLCQVSSTAFRAAFFSGLPITKRRNHSYAVRYYEWISDDAPRAPGLDATIYPGAQDLKFINDTPGAILIWTEAEGRRLYFDFYGTPDGREVLVDGPHPYDRKPSGAVKSTVTRIVKAKNGEAKELTLQSNYVSPNLYPKIYEYPKAQPPADFGANPKSEANSSANSQDEPPPSQNN